MNGVTDPKAWNGIPNDTNGCMRALLNERRRMERMAAALCKQHNKLVAKIQRTWRDRAYAANGCMLKRDWAMGSLW